MHILEEKKGKEREGRGKSEGCFAVVRVRRFVDDGQSMWRWRWRVRIQDLRIKVLR